MIMMDNISASVSKNRLIDISTEHFIEYGYGASALKKIASDAKLDKATIYHYFQSKADVAKHVIKKTSNFYEENLFYVIAKKELTSEERVSEFIKRLKSIIVNKQIFLIIVPILALENIPELIKPIQLQKNRWIKVMTLLLTPLHSTYLSERLSRNSWRLLLGALIDIKMSTSEARHIEIATELEVTLRRWWLKEI